MLTVLITLISLIFGQPYDRSDWIKSSSWSKARKKILANQKTGNHWICAYSLQVISNSTDLDIDHIIPLKYAFTHGGSKFPDNVKKAFATDDSNLVAVNEHENRSKGDKGVLEYMPPNNQCFYLRRWYYMSRKYHLMLDTSESNYIVRGLKGCKDPILQKKFK